MVLSTSSFHSAPPASSWRLPVTWLGLLAAAWAVYELTSQPALGTAVICLKFASEDIRTANWIWQSDSWQARGRACWWLYIAFGFCKASAIGGLTIFAIGCSIVMVGGIGAPADRLAQACEGAGYFAGVSLTLSFVAAVIAVELARRSGVRLWLDELASQARRKGAWPPRGERRVDNNLLPGLLCAGVAMPWMGCLLLLPMILPRGLETWAVLGIWLGIGFAFAPILFLRLIPVIALSPDECWTVLEVETTVGESPKSDL